MKIETFVRRPFDVDAVQVTPQNAEEIAEWCGGKVGTAEYKVAGTKVPLNIVLVPGNGPNVGRMVEARIGSWVVGHLGNFRVYQNKQLHNQFAKPENQTVRTAPTFVPGDLVQEVDASDGVWQGQVLHSDQVIVEYPFRGIVAHNRNELVKIKFYSEQTNKKWLLAAEADKGVPYDEALAKINAMREAAEAEFKMQGDLTDDVVPHELSNGMVIPELVPPVTEINGIRTGYVVRVKLEANMYYDQTGTVVGLGKDGVRVLVAMHDKNEIPQAVPFQADELEVIALDLVAESADELLEKIDKEVADRLASNPTPEQINAMREELGFPPIEPTPDLSYFKVGDMVEVQYGDREIGKISVLHDQHEGESKIEIKFSDGQYGYYKPHQLKKI